ncbi:DUF899 domain-containing protein [Mycolicibacterium litorale]|uniref:Dithiol-disulfide oxidoreductase (DUF899 family) n=1 Tax=Mycolicibacterium litorale TaxID=758802 RepID=A0AAD1MT37_9MYCO|nr:DUF899 domain-containing protein [Mycolicibacterium litorale]MCV7414616.1 DUF899 domain-containing protein [Mycolicibacterium litorale]TDY00889.1 putative dithiol-disulfide oxidoreductase (DUF899 family) [Mycolicibacterium litorale]BBY14787.1 hypothetical protein MLIT_03790 [Mycolicibacterium litorale]
MTADGLPPIVSRSEWEHARAELLVREKELTRLKDSVSAARRRLPMVEVTEPYVFDTETGPVGLVDLFDGRRQLIVQHFMFGRDWQQGCEGCSMMADHLGPLSHLHAKDTSLVLVSRAPLGTLIAFRERMGWDLPWVSSGASKFNEDFHVTVDGEERHGISVFLRDGERVFHTWSTYSRGEEPFMLVFDLLDLTPYGRQETWEDSPEGWPQRPPYEWMRLHDEY